MSDSFDACGRHPLLAAALAFFVGSVAVNDTQAQSAADQAVEFHIVRQSLAQALADFSRQAHILIVASSDVTSGKTCGPLDITATPAEALTRLLADSGLTFTQESDGSIVVKPGPAAGAAGTPITDTDKDQPSTRATSRNDAPGSDDTGLEEVVVTSERRSESLQRVPLAVSALSGTALTSRNIVNVQDFNAIAPNVTFGELNGVARINIRGVGNQNYFIGGDPSVAMYVDGAFISQASAHMSAFFDLDRVEILRGPQGTLYGRNATGGSVNLISRKPTDTFESYVTVTAGNNDLLQLEGAVSGPLTQGLDARIAVFHQTHDGYGVNEFNGRGIDNANRLFTRGQLSYDAGPSKLLLSFQGGQERDRNYGFHIFGTANPGTVTTGQLLGGHRAQDIRDVNSEAPLRNHRTTYSGTVDYSYNFSERFTVKSISNYRRYQQDFITDTDGTEIQYAAILVNIDSKQFSEELQANYEGERLKVVTGLYYFHETVEGDNRLGSPYTFTVHEPVPGPPGLFGIGLSGTVHDEALGAFAQSTWRFADNLDFIMGLRFSDESRRGDGSTYGPTSAFPTIPTPAHIHDSNVSVKAGLSWNLSPTVLGYATYSTGFKSGVILVGSTNPPAKPEQVDAYEIGMKGDYFDHRLRSNLAAFYYNYRDLQLSQFLPGAVLPVITNAATATSKGVEAEITVRPWPRLLIDVNAAWLDATFKSFASRDPRIPPPTVAPLVDLAGNRLPYAPEWSGTLQVDYRIPTGGLEKYASLTFSPEVSVTSRVDFSVFNHADLSQPGNTRFDASLRLDRNDDAWWVSAWVKNLSDKLTYANRTVASGITSNYAIYGTLTPPRTYGISGGVNF